MKAVRGVGPDLGRMGDEGFLKNGDNAERWVLVFKPWNQDERAMSQRIEPAYGSKSHSVCRVLVSSSIRKRLQQSADS